MSELSPSTEVAQNEPAAPAKKKPSVTRHQAIKKLSLLCNQMTKHAKAHNLQVYVMQEVENRQVGVSGHFSEEMLVNLAAHLGLQHPQAVAKAGQILATIMGNKPVESVKLVGADGSPIAPAMEVVKDEPKPDDFVVEGLG
jgi:hypothetical protein